MKKFEDLKPTLDQHFISTGYYATEAIKKALTPTGNPLKPCVRTSHESLMKTYHSVVIVLSKLFDNSA